jgi:RNA polymerase-binding transcription factor
LSKELVDNARRRLDEEADAIAKELVDLGATPDGSVDVAFDEGFADAAQTTSERAKVLSFVEGLRQRLDDVRAALSRIEKGTYGICERCGKQIDPERLEAVPAASLCISCAQKR